MAAVDRSFSDLLQDIIRNVQEIVRSEVRLAKTELREEAVKTKASLVLLGAGALTGFFAILFLLLMIASALALVMPNWAAALVVGIALAVAAGVMLVGRREELPANSSHPGTYGRNHKGEHRMGQTTNEIEAHIEYTRGELGANLKQLEQKVQTATDWKHHFQNSPMTLLGVAFGGGILLASMLGGRKSRPNGGRTYTAPSSSEPHAGTDHQKYKALETWDNIKGALIGVAATRFKDFVGEVVPGFQEQFQRTEDKAKALPGPARSYERTGV